MLLRISLVLLLHVCTFAQGYICAVGGGSENYADWSDAPYRWMVEKGKYGKVVILSVNDETSWIPNYFKSFGATNAVNLKIATRSVADLQQTYDSIVSANVVFIKGGDQYQYFSNWRQTKTEEAIKAVFARGGVIAGTSAGAMILGGIDFTAQLSSVTSKQALQNINSNLITLDTTFLNLQPDVLFDTHVLERGRFGRCIAFLSRMKLGYQKEIIVCGIDDRTAIAIDSLGVGTVMGSGAVSFYRLDSESEVTMVNGKFTASKILGVQATAGWKINMLNAEVMQTPVSAQIITPVSPVPLPRTALSFTGSSQNSAQLNYLTEFLNSTAGNNIVVFYTSGFAASAAQITDTIEKTGRSAIQVALSIGGIYDSATVQRVFTASGYIITGDSLQTLSQLLHGVSSVGTAMQDAINTRQVPVFLFGNAGKMAGSKAVGNTDFNYLASWQGRMLLLQGLDLWPSMMLQPRIFQHSDYYENRSSAMPWGVMRSRGSLGLFTDGNMLVQCVNGLLTFRSPESVPLMVFDYRNTTVIDSSAYRSSNSLGPRQAVAQTGIRISFTQDTTKAYHLSSGSFVPAVGIEENAKNFLPEAIKLEAYPNPTNGMVRVQVTLPEAGPVAIRVYDIVGRELTIIAQRNMQAGTTTCTWNNVQFGSGIYFIHVIAGTSSISRKVVLLK